MIKLIKILEAKYLEDKFINQAFTQSISVNDKLSFSKKDIYYLGNYQADKLNIIKDKLFKNRKAIINAIEKGVKFIVCGNSVELLNNHFKHDEINLFTLYNPLTFKKNFKKLKLRKDMVNLTIKKVDNLDKGINAVNFRYKNLLCISNEKTIDKIIKKQSKATLSC